MLTVSCLQVLTDAPVATELVPIDSSSSLPLGVLSPSSCGGRNGAGGLAYSDFDLSLLDLQWFSGHNGSHVTLRFTDSEFRGCFIKGHVDQLISFLTPVTNASKGDTQVTTIGYVLA